MTFNDLSDNEFEEFTYDLLASLDLSNLNWRRGSGKGGATADQGRDVVGQKLERDIDGHSRLETWFVQCKHYVAGVPPEKLEGAISWAVAERPAVLLFVISNFLSNPAKAWLEDYQANNRPAFRIKVWERKDLENLVAARPHLAVKYGLDTGLPLQSVHPAHLLYLLRPSSNTIEHLFEVLDRVGARDRDDLLSFCALAVINPRYRKPVTGDETMGELLLDQVDHEAFRRKCFKLVDGETRLGDDFLVKSIIRDTLTWACEFADPIEDELRIRRNRETITRLSTDIGKEDNPKRRENLQKMMEMCQDSIDAGPQRLETAIRRYRLLCEKVLPALYLEEATLPQPPFRGVD